MELNELMVKYGTDKQKEVHNYVQFYEKYFTPIKEEKLKILEIGIYRPPVGGKASVGASLKTWGDYFINSEIYGVDLDSFTDVDDSRIKTIMANQEFRYKNNDINGLNDVVEKFGPEFDIIVEDGGHTMLQQQLTLGFMFKFLKPNGLFVIEDLHTSYFAPFAYNKTGTQNTTLKMIEDYLKSNRIESEFMLEEEKDYLNNNILKMELYKGTQSEIVFITKK